MSAMSPRVRKLALTLHVLSSVGWCGAVAGFLALAVAGLRSADVTTVRSAYLCMNLITQDVIVPVSVASLLSGIASSLGTPWGLLRHYWVIAKLVITTASTGLLLLHSQAIEYMAAAAAARAAMAGDDLRRLRVQLAADAAAAMVALIVTTALAIYKPRGMTAAARRRALATPR